MAKYVENCVLSKMPARALTSPTFKWSFIVQSSRGLDVPNSPTLPSRTFFYIHQHRHLMK